MDPGSLWVLIVIGFAGVTVASRIWSPEAKVKRRLKRAPHVALRDLPEGTCARVVGAAQALEATLEGPLTGRPCLYYVVTVEQYKQAGRSGHWRRIIREESGVPFLLDDGTGHAIIDPRNANVALDVDGTGSSGTFDNPTLREGMFLTKHGESGVGILFNKRLRYREAVIEIGETVAILGEGVREPDPSAPPADAYRGDQPTRIRMTSSPRYPLVISDNPKTTV